MAESSVGGDVVAIGYNYFIAKCCVYQKLKKKHYHFKMSNPVEKTYSVQGLADLLNISVTEVTDWVNKSKIKPFRIFDDGTKRYRVEEIMVAISEHKLKPISKPENITTTIYVKGQSVSFYEGSYKWEGKVTNCLGNDEYRVSSADLGGLRKKWFELGK